MWSLKVEGKTMAAHPVLDRSKSVIEYAGTVYFEGSTIFVKKPSTAVVNMIGDNSSPGLIYLEVWDNTARKAVAHTEYNAKRGVIGFRHNITIEPGHDYYFVAFAYDYSRRKWIQTSSLGPWHVRSSANPHMVIIKDTRYTYFEVAGKKLGPGSYTIEKQPVECAVTVKNVRSTGKGLVVLFKGQSSLAYKYFTLGSGKEEKFTGRFTPVSGGYWFAVYSHVNGHYLMTDKWGCPP